MPIGLDLKTVCSTGGAAANNCTFSGIAGYTFYLTGFEVSGLGATGASTISITISGTASTNTPTYYIPIPAGVTTQITPLSQRFSEKGIQASGTNVSVTVNVPSFGAGNTNASCIAMGYYA